MGPVGTKLEPSVSYEAFTLLKQIATRVTWATCGSPFLNKRFFPFRKSGFHHLGGDTITSSAGSPLVGEFNPFEKSMLLKLDHFLLKYGVKTNNSVKPAPRCFYCVNYYNVFVGIPLLFTTFWGGPTRKTSMFWDSTLASQNVFLPALLQGHLFSNSWIARDQRSVVVLAGWWFQPI